MSENLKKWIKTVVFLLITAVLLYFAFRGMDWKAFAKSMAECNWWWIIASMLTGLFSTMSRGYRWRIMMLPINKQLTRVECYDAYAICYLANLALPRSGEVIRCGIVAETGKVSFQEALGNMVVERTWDLITTILVAILMVVCTPFGNFIVNKMWIPMKDQMSVWWLVGIVAVVVVIVAFFWLIFSNSQWLGKSAMGAKFLKFAQGLKDGVKATFVMKEKGLFFFHTIFIQICYWAQVLFIIYAMPEFRFMNGMDALFITVVGSVAWLVPVQGGFGAYHVLVTLALVPIYGVTQQAGLTFATISHESQILQMIICGLLSLVALGIRKKNSKKAVAAS